jgi:hypothetical protein
VNTDVGLLPALQADSYTTIGHIVLWNGIGASYNIMPNLIGSLYARNLFSRYSASGTVPGGGDTNADYVITNDTISVELKVAYKINAKAEVFAKVIIDNHIITRSAALNAQSSGFFIENINNSSANDRPTPVATVDNVLNVRIHIGIILKLQ